MSENVDSGFWQKRSDYRDEAHAVMKLHGILCCFDRNWNFGPLAFLDDLPEIKSQQLVSDLKALAFTWAEKGFLYGACQIYEKLGLSTVDIYNIAKQRSGDSFGTDYEEYVLISEHGTQQEIDFALTTCKSVQGIGVGHYQGQFTEKLKFILQNDKDAFGRELQVRGSEFLYTHDLVGQYDALIGIANSGVAVPLIASALGHTNTAIVDYHRKWQKRGPRWIKKPSSLDADKILICDNDASTGITLRHVVNFVRKHFEVSSVDVAFTLPPNGQSVKIAESIDGIQRAFDLNDFPLQQPFTRICEIHDAILKICQKNAK